MKKLPKINKILENIRAEDALDILKNLAKDNEFMAYKHTGFWQCMDTIRDADYLNELWKTNPEWKIWD